MELNGLVSEITIKDSASAVADRISAAMDRVTASEEKIGSTKSYENAARGFENLKRAQDPVYARMQDLANIQTKLNDYVAKGVTTQSEANEVYARAVDSTQRQIKALGDHASATGNASAATAQPDHPERSVL